MLKIFCPDFRFDSIASIPVEWLKKQQVERVILDVDNTLLPVSYTHLTLPTNSRV